MSRIDDLDIGTYVAISHINGEYQTHKGQPMVTGEPMLILAISLPFIAVQDTSGVKCAVDVRVVTLQKMSKEYARVFFRKLKGTCCGKPVVDTGKLKSSVYGDNPHLPDPILDNGWPMCPRCKDITLNYSSSLKCLVCPRCEQRVRTGKRNK